MFSRAFSLTVLIGGQALLAFGGLAALRLQPPADGDMVLIPLGGQGQSELITLALDHDLRIVAQGGWPGSLVVRGNRARLGWALRDHGVLVLATDARGCAPA